jgi:hypothetical protein
MGAGLQGGERGEDGSSTGTVRECVFGTVCGGAHTIALKAASSFAPPLADVAATPKVIFGIVFMDTEQVPP